MFYRDSDKDYISETEAKIPNDSPSYAPNTLYALRALVTHYGRHENGHYIAYRQGSISTEDDECPWWRLSDDDVSMIHEDDVMNQGGVFMLFYERLAGDKDVKEHLAKGEAEEPQINGMPVEDRDVKQGTVKEPLTEKEVEKPHINDIPVELEASIEQSANAPLANGQSLEQRKELLLG